MISVERKPYWSRHVFCSSRYILGVVFTLLARFSPDDKYSRERVTCKERYGCLLTQQPDMKL